MYIRYYKNIYICPFLNGFMLLFNVRGGGRVRSAEGGGRGQVELMSRRLQGLKLSVTTIWHRGQSAPIFWALWFFHSWYDELEVANDGFFHVWSTTPCRLFWLYHAVIFWWEDGCQSCVPLYQWRLAVLMRSVFWCWGYWRISSLLSHLWFFGISHQSYWYLICVGCYGIGILNSFSRRISVAPSSHIPIVIDWWEWQGR